MNSRNINIFLLLFFLTSSLFGGTYDDKYRIVSKSSEVDLVNENRFMDGKFLEIIRFDALLFEDSEELSADSSKYLKKMIKDIKKYIDDSKKINITIIGHTDRPTDDSNEKKVDSKTYANSVENWFRYSLDNNQSQEASDSYALNIQTHMLDNEIPKNIVTVEYRNGKDIVFSDETSVGRDLSNRVMVTVYVEIPEDIDSDRDGVFDTMDMCSGTPRNSKVDKYGCPIDSDGDGVLDYKDSCPDTLISVNVDKKGCPLDSDGDGVFDYKDRCLETDSGFQVDLHGCPLNKTLGLNFKTSSAKILQNSYAKIVEFAEFLKLNSAYKVEIIGHTDSVGKADANMILSNARAEAVKNALVEQGIEESKLSFRGRGELEPLKSNRTAEGRRVNRRIEVKLK